MRFFCRFSPMTRMTFLHPTSPSLSSPMARATSRATTVSPWVSMVQFSVGYQAQHQDTCSETPY